MRVRGLAAAAVILTVAWAPACSKKSAPTRTEAQAYKEAKAAYYEAETPEAKAAIAETYLAEFPGGEHAPSFVWVEVENRGTRLGQKERAFDTVQASLEATKDPARRLDMVLTVYPLVRELHKPLDLGKAIAAVEKHRPLSFEENRSVMEMASKYEEWNLLLDRANAALAEATLEAVRAESGDRKLDPEKLRRRVDGRSAEAMAYKAWALFNTGDTAGAEHLFAAAEARSPRNYVGLPTSPAALFAGRAALKQQDWDHAMELLAPGAVMGGNGEAMAGLRTAWMKKTGSKAGFEEYLWDTRQKLARKVDDFSLPDYEGTKHTLSKELGKVTFLAFWFPT